MTILAHYFTNDEQAQSNEKTFKVNVVGKNFDFITDIGVFSKGELDDASRFLIETVDTLKLQGSILDVGCGYGAIGVVLAKLNPENMIHMIDVNLRAIDLAKRNAQKNGVSNVTVYESHCYESVTGTFSHIISNPPIRAGKKVVHEILEKSIEHLDIDGTLTIVIGKQHGAPSAMKKMEDVFGNCERLERKKGFWILRSVKKG